MKKFLVECFMLLVVFFSTASFLYHADIPSDIAKKFLNINERFEIVNLGTSHGGGFDYSNVKLCGGSFNTGGNSLYYDLQNYLYFLRIMKGLESLY